MMVEEQFLVEAELDVGSERWLKSGKKRWIEGGIYLEAPGLMHLPLWSRHCVLEEA